MFHSKNFRRAVLAFVLLFAAVSLFVRLYDDRAASLSESSKAVINRVVYEQPTEPVNTASGTAATQPQGVNRSLATKLSPAMIAAREQLAKARGANTGRPWEQISGWQGLSEKEKVIELISEPFVVQTSGAKLHLELALDEVFVPHLPNGKRLQKVPLQADARAMVETIEQMHQPGTPLPQLVFYVPGRERDEVTRRVLTEQVLTESANVAASVAHARAAGFGDSAEFDAVPGFVLTRAEEIPGQALLVAAALTGHPDSKSVELVMNREMSKRLVPNDPLFTRQWHLRNTGQSGGKAGTDAKVVNVWDNHRGQGVTVAVIDDGVQHDHPDLVGNYSSALSIDYVDSDSNPYPDPDFDDHGTAVAGVIAATQGNTLGVSGAAPLSTLAGYRLLGDNQNDTRESQAFNKDNNVVQVKNNSWGPFDNPGVLGTIGSAPRVALQNAALTGRGGLGTIVVFAAGNGRSAGDQGNKDAYANSIYTFSIGAVTNTGALSYYSETGAQLIAVAPSSGGSLGIATTDLMGDDGYNRSSSPIPKDYTGSFGGTSSAAPLASAVIALMLEANPNLGWRDVKEILLRSSTKLSPTSTGWVSRYGGNSALAPIKHHHSYGGGMVNAEAAVAMAQGWTNLPAQVVPQTKTDLTDRSIPDNNSNGITIPFDFSSISPMRLEMVTVAVSIEHFFKGDLTISLVSPTGVTSTLATQTLEDFGADYVNWTFTSNRHWGDSGQGIWKLVIKDLYFGDTGVLDSATVTLHGTAFQPAVVSSEPVSQLRLTASAASFSTAGTGDGDLLFQWHKNTTSKIVGATASTFTIPSLALTHAGRYSCRVSNVTGSDDTNEVYLGVVDSAAPTFVVAENGKVTLQAKAQGPAGGPTLTYRWYRGMMPLSDGDSGFGAVLSGTGTSKMTITNAQLSDSAAYRCEVTMGALTQFSGDFTVHIVQTPVVQVPMPNQTTYSVSQALSLPILSSGFPSAWTITGLPSGLKYDKKTGIISGTPNVGGDFTIKVKAKNPAGTGEMSFILSLQALPDRVVGTFRGLVARNILGTNDLGGFLVITTSKSGTFTGSITRGSKTHRISNRLISTAAADVMMPNPSTASFNIKQTGTLPQLTLAFSIDPADGKLTGTLSEGATWSANVEAWENPFSTTAPTSEFEGVYNTALKPPSGVVEGQQPHGCSYGRLTVSKTGATTWAGRLADGTSATFSTAIGKTGRVAMHKLFYTNTGSYRGWITVNPDPGSSFANNTISADLDWLKKLQPSSARSYETGFHQTGITGVGAKWVKPVFPNIVLGLPGGAKYTFSNGGITTSWLVVMPATTLAYSFALSDKNVASRLLPNPANVTITFSATTGIFTGTAILSDSIPVVKRTISYGGIMISGTENKGLGYFTLPKLPVPPQKATTTDILSGLLELGVP